MSLSRDGEILPDFAAQSLDAMRRSLDLRFNHHPIERRLDVGGEFAA